MKKTKQTALTAAMFAAAMGMSACSKLPMQEVSYEPDVYYYSATENEPVSLSLLHGDINGDGDITVEDVVMFRKYLKNQQAFTEKQFQNADINQDGIVNIFDAVAQTRILIYGDWMRTLPQPVYGPPEWFEETTELTETIPQPVYGPPEWFETTEPTETEYDPESEEQYDVYGPPAWFEETTEPTETEYDPETEEQYDVYGPPAWFDETTEPPTEQLPQPEYGPPEIFE